MGPQGKKEKETKVIFWIFDAGNTSVFVPQTIPKEDADVMNKQSKTRI